MKTKAFIFIVALFVAAVAVHAQQISVVTPGGATTLYTSLDDAISGAEAGSTVYLSGGGFQVRDETKITKQLTLVGIGHRTDNENADGNTTLNGNLFFEGGSDNSALMGLYLSGNVNIGTSETAVNTILVRYCNVNSILVKNSGCQGVLINQNYIRSSSDGGNSAITFSNNIIHSIRSVIGGVIDHNLIRYAYNYRDYYMPDPYHNITGSTVTNNICREGNSPSNRDSGNSGNQVSNNIYAEADGNDPYATVPENWDEVFVGPDKGVNPASNFALKGTVGKNGGSDGTDIGIYGGSGFSDSARPPGPRIVSKKVGEQTDAAGNLRVEIKVSTQ
ncbi:MAG: hypothetical protein LBF85_05115 [Tannerella sp.]|jgi:hypothetical protein|nr:hypothetical protein [Tannerella sp.]